MTQFTLPVPDPTGQLPRRGQCELSIRPDDQDYFLFQDKKD